MVSDCTVAHFMAGTTMQLEPVPHNNTVRREPLFMTSEERREIRYQRRKAKRDEARLKRSMACGDFDEVFSFRHLYLSAKKCCKGVYWKSSTQRYISNLIPNISETLLSLRNGTFIHRGFHEFYIMERGKKRHIRSVHISERTVQKCLCDYCIVPIYSASFIYDNSASLKHRGMDFALRRMVYHLERHFRKHGLAGGILIYDFKSFFDDAPHEPLLAEAERRLHDDRIRALHNSFITDFGPVGLDHYFKEVLGIEGYARYMDDGYAIHEDLDYLKGECMLGLEEVTRHLGLRLNWKKTRVVPLVDFYRWLKTKFIVTPQGKVILKMNPASTKIIRRKLRSFYQKWQIGEMTLADIRNSVDSYNGHMMRGNSYKVRERTNQYFKSMFGFYPNKKGWERNVSNVQRRSCTGNSYEPCLGQKAG